MICGRYFRGCIDLILINTEVKRVCKRDQLLLKGGSVGMKAIIRDSYKNGNVVAKALELP